MTRDGEPITAYPLKRSIYTGIAYEGDARTRMGLVSEFEERDAARETGYTWAEWLDMDTRERAAAIAYYRLSAMVSLHAQDAVTRHRELEEFRRRANHGA